MKKEIKGVIFDLDNTILNSSKIIDDANKEVINEMKRDFDEISEDFFNEMHAKTDIEYKKIEPSYRHKELFYELFAKASGFDMDREKIRKYSDTFEEVLLTRMEFTEGIEEVIDAIKNNGLKMGLLTGEGMYTGLKRKTLEKIGFMEKFDVKIIAREGIPESKSDPGAFKRTAGLMGLKPDEVLFIGDVPEVDIDNAKSAGMFTVLFDRYNTEKGRVSKSVPDYIIEDMKQIYRILSISP